MTATTQPASGPNPPDTGPALQVDGLTVELDTPDGVIRPADGVSLRVDAGQTLAVLGESGSGKTITAQALMGILEPGTARVAGVARLDGEDLLAMSEARRRRLRGPGIAMVFQDALVALNPVYSVGWQVAEPLRLHTDLGRGQVHDRVVELLDRVGIPDTGRRLRDYPHQFSGGMRQRLLIAMAMALTPRVLIADEPTTALDVTVQAQILALLAELRAESGTALVLITHDLALAAEEADRVAVMYAGRVVETGTVAEVLGHPRHPYTRGLLASVSPPAGARRLTPVPGAPPVLLELPTGCSFHPRCPLARDRCRTEAPAVAALGDGRTSACHFHEEV